MILYMNYNILPPVLALALLTTACGGVATIPNSLDGAAAAIYSDDCSETTGEQVTIYSGRSKDLIEPALDAFECATGISTVTNFGDPTDLALNLVEEGDRTPADVFLSKSPGAVGFLQNAGVLRELSSDVTDLVADENTAASGTWVGITGRQRVLVYNIDLVDASDLPSSILELTDEKYRGKVGIPAGNGSFQDWFTVFRAQHGDDVATAWINDMVANEAIVTESNRPTVDAVGRGEFEFGLVNHYYNYQEVAALGDAHRALNHTFAADDIGSLVIVTAAGVTTNSDNVDEAEELISFLLSEGAQTYFTTDTLEYPLSANVEPADVLPPLGDDGADFDVKFDDLGDGLQRTIEIIEASGING
ncbi:MAG: iron(III) transport system substrate-binding protein [Verrucomicrobiales bacterium]|jgi:iron(III) transport system substrate-binding protein